MTELTLYRTPKDLPKHYRQFAERSKPWDMFYHRFYVSPFPLAMPTDIKTVLALRRKRALEAYKARGRAGYIAAHERPYRIVEAVRWGRDLARRERVTARQANEFWKSAAWVWTDAEIDENSALWTYLCMSAVPHPELIMTAKERRALRDMPETITVYRGVQGLLGRDARDEATTGWSWTLSEDVAKFFARRGLHRLHSPCVLQAEVPKAIVRAYLTGRGEEEILIDPESGVEVTAVFQITRSPEPLRNPEE